MDALTKDITLVGAKKQLSKLHAEAHASMMACNKATIDAYAKLKTDFTKLEAEAKQKMESMKKAAADEVATLQKEAPDANTQTVVGAMEQALKETAAKLAVAEKELASKLTVVAEKK